MVKFVIYTSNLSFMPKNMNDVINFAKEQNKFMISSVELNPCLSDVKAGDNIITKKGNSIYVIKTIDTSLENLDEDTQDYLDTLTREYGLRKVNITKVDHIIKFETWCKYAKPIINSKTSNKMTTKHSIKNFADRLKSMFMPVEAEGVRIATDGNICVATSQGYVSIDDNNSLTSYPEELTLDLPVFIVSKPKEQLAVGDVIALDNSYAKVTKINGSKITAIGYTGSGKTVHTIKDFLFNQTMVRVVVSLAGSVGGQINPMMLLALSDKDDKKSLLPLMMMTQNGGTMSMNPMMMLAMSDGELDIKTLAMMSMASKDGNIFSQMFGSQNSPAPTKGKRSSEADDRNTQGTASAPDDESVND